MSERFEPTHEQIEQRAYEIFVERGYEHGGDVEDWFAAEQQLRDLGFEEVLRSEREAHPSAQAQTEEPGEGSGVRSRRKVEDVGLTVGATSSS
jgi:hypothetical protein